MLPHVSLQASASRGVLRTFWSPRRLRDVIKRARTAHLAAWASVSTSASAAARPAGAAAATAAAAKAPVKQLIHVDARMQQYLLDHSREPQVLADLREETQRECPSGARMLVPPEQGAFMAWLVGALGVRWALELGVFTGYSSTAMALAMPEGGRLVACDRDPRSLAIARRWWERAGVSHKIDERLGQAADTLQELLDAGGEGTFDLAFIDADKRATTGYFEQCLQLVRPGGTVLVDNALFRGRVADPLDGDRKVAALRDFNARLAEDDRIHLSIVPVGDGLALCRRLR